MAANPSMHINMTSALPSLFGFDDRSATNLAACVGDCDDHIQCADGLKCFDRQNTDEPVPGCTGDGPYGWNYCYDPNSEYVCGRWAFVRMALAQNHHDLWRCPATT